MSIYTYEQHHLPSKYMSKKWLLVLLPILFISISITILTRSHAPYIANVQGVSMLPTVEDGDKVLFRLISSGDKIGKVHLVRPFKTPYIEGGLSIPLIKRVIAGPGDTLVFHNASGHWLAVNDQKVVINAPEHHKNKVRSYRGVTIELIAGQVEHLGSPIYFTQTRQFHLEALQDFPYLDAHTDSNGFSVVHIPAEHYFLLSDTWLGTQDSRYFGPVHKKYLRDQVLAVIPKHRFL